MADVTNGASLEDSHTNFFALADLNQPNGMNQSNGINWRRLCTDNVLCFDPLDDPVLSSYSKCLSADILCVWRRVVNQKSCYNHQNAYNDSNQLNHNKELWIFWYGEEPDLNGLVGPNLREAEQGSWESGLSYECRALLFKALHNLIEKYLLSKGFTRLGRFFIEPQSLSHGGASKSQIAFAFSFFVHGESTVCTSVDMRASPSVYPLKKCHLQAACAGDRNIKVILSPYGMQGTLTGTVFRQNDNSISKLLSEWYSFYPKPIRKGNTQEHDLPAAVEVLIGGVRMKYPTSYVFVVDTSHVTANGKSGARNVSPSARYTGHKKPCPSLNILTPPTSPERSSENMRQSRFTSNSVFRENVIDYENSASTPLPSVVKLSVNEEVRIPLQTEGIDDATVLWDFQDPCTILKCTCPRRHSISSGEASHSLVSDSPFASRAIKSERAPSLTRFTSFHKRPIEIFSDGIPATKGDLSNQEMSVASAPHAYNANQIKSYSASQSVNGGMVALPQLHTPLTQPSSVESHSNIPSVEAGCSQICSSDPIMPTLSPHPKTENHVSFTHSPNTDIGPTINIKEEHMSDEMLSSFRSSLLAYFEEPKENDCTSGIKTEKKVSPAVTASNCNESDQTQPQLKRPILPSSHHENEVDDELVMRGLLYDYTMTSPLSEPPSRKRRMDKELYSESKDDEICEVILDSSDSMSPYDGVSSYTPKDPYEFTDMDEGTPSESLRHHMDTRIKEEERVISPRSVPSPEDRTSNSHLENNKVPASTETKNTVVSPFRTAQPKFIREEDLTVSVHDLDNIFDTSSSDNDDMFTENQANKMPVMSDDCTVKVVGFNMTTGLLELSRMYPTPPSLEQNNVQSPLGTNCASDRMLYEETNKDKELADILSTFLSCEGKVHSWVWKPEEQQLPLESEEYSPLKNLHDPNTLPPKLWYKPSWQQGPENGISSNLNMGMMYCNDQLSDQAVQMNHQEHFLMGEDGQSYSTSDHGMDPRFISMCTDLQSPVSNSSPYLNKHIHSDGDDSMSPPIPEAHGLFVNLLLSDSMLNIFKDHNFDSCAICVCNMNIKGADVGINLPNVMVPYMEDDSYSKCTCGFSAVVYRHRSHCAGLFNEDEFDITGFMMDKFVLSRYADAPVNALPLKRDFSTSNIPPSIVDLIKVQCKALCSSFSIFQKPDMHLKTNAPQQLNLLEIRDSCEVCFSALDAGKNVMDNIGNCRLNDNLKPTCLHRWPYVNNPLPCSSQEMMLHLDMLKPMLQEAVHCRNSRPLWEVTYLVAGPLTWRQFHQLAAQGSENQCEPQPIPSVTVGYDRDYLSLSPLALKNWDKLLLEPYSLPCDVSYIVVAPENNYILSHVKAFFRELSSVYELLKLGRHSPISKVLRQGIMRVGRNAAMKLAEEPIDDWFNQIGDSPVSNKLKLYARVCRHHLAPYLSEISSELTSEKASHSTNRPTPPAQETPEHSVKVPDGAAENSSESSSIHHNSSTNSSSSNDSLEEEEQQSPAIVIYIVEPFSYASVDPNVYRTVTLGLLLSYHQMLDYLPDSLRDSISLQLISLDSLLCLDKSSVGTSRKNEMKSLAFSVYSQCHRILPRQLSVKSLTGFGPAAAQNMFLLANEKHFNPLMTFRRPLVLAPHKDKQAELGEMFGDGQEKSGILYCSYCLTEDRRWLLASCTNNNGEIMETTIINIATSNRKKSSAVRRRGLTKLLEFILEVLSHSAQPWRIIIGRLGRLGHGELRDWSALLSRKSLLSYSRHLQEICKQCSDLGPCNIPSILSACLVSVEPDTVLKLMPDQFTMDTHENANVCLLSTPEDASCTHILVFPTSATMQSSLAASHQEHIDTLTGGLGDDILFALNDDDINVGQELNDIFRWSESPTVASNNSPHLDNITHAHSPNIGELNLPFNVGGAHKSMYAAADCLDEPLQLLQQPLALGYYVSTAKTGRLPNWFWSSCPHLANRLPVFLKFALLIHLPSIHQNSDDILHANTTHQNCHPLDSHYTTDVLRYVLEGHNALSWLSLDPSSQDRRSCLPIHIQLLMQLYSIVENLL